MQSKRRLMISGSPRDARVQGGYISEVIETCLIASACFSIMRSTRVVLAENVHILLTHNLAELIVTLSFHEAKMVKDQILMPDTRR